MEEETIRPAIMPCILCGVIIDKPVGTIKNTYSWFIGRESFDVYDCEQCGTRFAAPYREQDYNFIFDSTDLYKSHLEFARKLKVQEDPSWALIGLGQPYYAVFDYLRGKKNLNILDVGCSYGYMTYVLRLMGHQAFGADVSRQAVHFARGLFGDFYYQSNVENIVTDGEKFDLIFSIEVLEHLVNPMEFLRSALQLIKDTGAVLITTPNKDYVQCYSSRPGLNHGELWIMEKPPVHWAIYGKSSMEYMAQQNNLNLKLLDFPGLSEVTGSVNLAAVFTKK